MSIPLATEVFEIVEEPFFPDLLLEVDLVPDYDELFGYEGFTFSGVETGKDGASFFDAIFLDDCESSVTEAIQRFKCTHAISEYKARRSEQFQSAAFPSIGYPKESSTVHSPSQIHPHIQSNSLSNTQLQWKCLGYRP